MLHKARNSARFDKFLPRFTFMIFRNNSISPALSLLPHHDYEQPIGVFDVYMWWVSRSSCKLLNIQRTAELVSQ